MFNHSRNKIEVTVKITYENDNIVYFQNIEKLYYKIKDCKYVPRMKFGNNFVETAYCGRSLNLIKKPSETDKQIIKKQIIEFIRYLYSASIAHRDLWINNICWDGNQIWVIDWEYIIDHKPNNISEHYDLIGIGLPSPEKTNNMHIFHRHRTSIKNWLYPIPFELTEF